ncbi:MAG: hypothetical protein AAGH74_10760 [Pseudomonadota bacterium]
MLSGWKYAGLVLIAALLYGQAHAATLTGDTVTLQVDCCGPGGTTDTEVVGQGVDIFAFGLPGAALEFDLNAGPNGLGLIATNTYGVQISIGDGVPTDGRFLLTDLDFGMGHGLIGFVFDINSSNLSILELTPNSLTLGPAVPGGSVLIPDGIFLSGTFVTQSAVAVPLPASLLSLLLGLGLLSVLRQRV